MKWYLLVCFKDAFRSIWISVFLFWVLNWAFRHIFNLLNRRCDHARITWITSGWHITRQIVTGRCRTSGILTRWSRIWWTTGTIIKSAISRCWVLSNIFNIWFFPFGIILSRITININTFNGFIFMIIVSLKVKDNTLEICDHNSRSVVLRSLIQPLQTIFLSSFRLSSVRSIFEMSLFRLWRLFFICSRFWNSGCGCNRFWLLKKVKL